MMNISRLAAVVKNPRTTAKWIEEQIELNRDNDERLAILVTSNKANPDTLESIWEESDNAAIALGIAGNEQADEETLLYIAEVAYDNRHEWSEEECQQIIDTLRENQSTPAEANTYLYGEDELEDEMRYYDDDDDDDDDDYREKDDDYGDIMSMIDFYAGGADNW